MYEIIKKCQKADGISSKEIKECFKKQKPSVDIGHFSVMKTCRCLWKYHRICRRRNKVGNSWLYSVREYPLTGLAHRNGDGEIVKSDGVGWEFCVTYKERQERGLLRRREKNG